MLLSFSSKYLSINFYENLQPITQPPLTHRIFTEHSLDNLHNLIGPIGFSKD